MALPPYATIAEIKEQSLSPEQIKDQIVVRKVLIHTMVGSLYPSILTEEIDTLLSMLQQETPPNGS